MDTKQVKDLCKSSIETGINVIKNLYEIKRKKQHITINAISNKKTSIGFNSADSKSKFEKYIEKKRKIFSENDEKLMLLNVSQSGDSATYHLFEIKQNAESSRKELDKIHKVLKNYIEDSKNIRVNKNDKNYIIYDKKCFEIYCLMNQEINKKPINSNYGTIKEKWLKYISDFFAVFQSVKNWGDITNPIDIDASREVPLVEMKSIAFKEEWYSKPIENSAIEAVDSGLAGIFNNLLEMYPRFASTHLKTYSPYQTDDYKAPKKIITKLFMTTAGKFAVMNENLLISAKGLNEYEIESLNIKNSDYFEDDTEKKVIIPAGAPKKRKARQKDSDSDEESSSSNEDEPTPLLDKKATLTEAKYALSELNKTINETVKTSTEFFSQFSQLIDSLEQKSSLFFKEREYPPLNIYSWNLDEMIGRCDTLIAKSNNIDIVNIKNTFSHLLQRLLNHKTKFPLRTPYYNSFDNAELISNWGDVFIEVDKQLDTLNNLRVIKLNMFDPVNQKVIDSQQNTFLIDKQNHIMDYRVDKSDKNNFYTSLYKSEIDSITIQIDEISRLVQILENLNKVMDNNINFRNWFSSEKIMSIKRRFYKFNNDNFNPKLNYHEPGERKDILTDPYFNDLFNRSLKHDVVLKPDKIDFFNEAIRGYYSNPKIMSFEIKNNNPTFIDNPNEQMNLFAGTFYPGCFTKNCQFQTTDLVHLPNLGEDPNNYKQIKLLLDISDLNKDLNVPMIIIIQSIREQLNFTDNRFDLTSYDEKINKLKEKLEDIYSLKDKEFKVKFDVFADTNETMQPIIAKSNIDRSLAKNQDSITLTKGSSGSGKTFTINGNGSNKKGFFEALASMDPNLYKVQIELFEYYHIAMPFEESFLDSVNKKFTKPRLWRYDINSTTYAPSLLSVDCFQFNSSFPILSFIKNYSRSDNSGIRSDIDTIRSNTNSLREFTTIRQTVNNKVSSRSVFLQALKVQKMEPDSKASYNIIIDRPGEEDPLETFNLKKLKIDNFTPDQVLLALNNPIIGFLNKYNNGDDFYNKKINWNHYFNAIGLVKLEKDMLFIEYFETFLKGTFRKSTTFKEMTADMTSSYLGIKKGVSVDEYISEQFMNDLDHFANVNYTNYEHLIQNRFKELLSLDEPILNFLKNIHKNEEWLDFEISCENFKDFNDSSQNILFNGFRFQKIKIRDLFFMEKAIRVLKTHNGNLPSKFLDLFASDNFFNQIECPLLGLVNYFEIFNFDLNAELFPNFLSLYKKNNQTGLNYYISQNYLSNIIEYAIKDIEYQLSLDLYASLSSYGNQSFLNTHVGITNFLMGTAFYFSIFKNPNYVDFYDNKIKKYYDVILNGKFESVRGFFEAVSINEINNNQQTLDKSFKYSQPKQNISLNSVLFNSMKYYNDLVLPKIGIYDEYDRVASSVKHSVVDFTCKSQQNLTLRLNRLAVFMRHLDESEINFTRWAEKYQYIMTRVFNKDAKWLSVSHSNFENSSEHYIEESQLLEVYVFNPFVEKMESGRKSCISIINNMI